MQNLNPDLDGTIKQCPYYPYSLEDIYSMEILIGFHIFVVWRYLDQFLYSFLLFLAVSCTGELSPRYVCILSDTSTTTSPTTSPTTTTDHIQQSTQKRKK